MDTNKIKVNIAGTVYTIIGEKTRAEVEEIANFVDEEIKKITSHNYLLNSTMAATLVALNISSDYFDLKKEINLLSEDSEFPIKKQEEFLKNNQKIEKENAAILKKAGKCEKCGKPFEIKNGRWGKFLACTGYPECKNIKKIEKK